MRVVFIQALSRAVGFAWRRSGAHLSIQIAPRPSSLPVSTAPLSQRSFRTRRLLDAIFITFDVRAARSSQLLGKLRARLVTGAWAGYHPAPRSNAIEELVPNCINKRIALCFRNEPASDNFFDL